MSYYINDINSANETEEKYTYYAFISYKHEDEKWARWIQNKLETYKLPSILQKENKDLPNKISPVFRDKTDITSGPLMKTLSKELASAKYLIVVCSPRSANSSYVNYEVEQFIQLGRQDNIIPFIVEGEVKTENSTKECYVPALLNMDEIILGVDLPKIGKRKAFLIIIAKMLDIKLDALVRRDKQRRKKYNVIRAAILAIVMVCGFFLCDYYVPKTNYYSDYVLQWGLPKGIFRIEKGIWPFRKSEAKGLEDYYIITENKSMKTIVMKHVNSVKIPIDYNTSIQENDRPVIAEYEYKLSNGKKHVASAKYMDKFENVLIVLKFSDDSSVVDFTNGDGSNSPITLASSLFAETGMLDVVNIESKSSITRHVYEYDKNGYMKSAKFMRDNRATTPTPDKNGIVGYTNIVDDYGRTICKQLTYSFNSSIVSKVSSEIRYEYSKKSANLLSISYVDADGNLVMNSDNYAKKVFKYYDNGNVRDINYYDISFKPCIYSKGYAHVHFVQDNHGFNTEASYYDAGDLLVIPEFGYAKEKIVYDKRGNQTEVAVFDINEKPMIALPKDTDKYVSGFSIIRLGYNEKNMLISHHYYNEKRKPMLCTGGYAELDAIYNEKGLVKEVSYYDVNRKPVKCKEGFEKFTKEYNKNGQLSDTRYCDSNDNLVDTIWGFSCIQYEYDENRNVNRIYYYGKDNKLILNNNKFAQREINYDDRGLLLSESFFDIDGKLIVTSWGYAKNENEYNENGYCIKEAYYDEKEKLMIVDSLGYALYKADYDKFGNTTKLAYYASEEKPMINKNYGYALYTAKYNNQGKKVEEVYYDQNNHFIVPSGYEWARHIIKYHDNGLPTSESFYDINNKLTMNNKFGYAKIIIKYDQWNNRSEADFYNAKDELFISPVYGCATVKYICDGKKLLKESYYDIKGNLIISTIQYYAELINTYDKKGNLVEASIYNENGKPMTSLYQYSSVKYQYNKNNQVISQEYCDVDGKPVVAKDCGYAKKINEYEKDKTIIKTIYYDEKGNIMKFEDITKQTFIFIAEVNTQSTAQEAGIKVNDILLKYNDWNYFTIADETVSINELKKEIVKGSKTLKTIVVYRPTDASIHSFHVKTGLLGVRFNDVPFHFSNKDENQQYIGNLEKLYQLQQSHASFGK